MAIVEMKRFTLLAPKADKEKLLRAMQRMNCVEIIGPSKEEEAFAEKEKTGAEETETKLKRLSWALDQLKRFDDAPKPMFGTYPEIPPGKGGGNRQSGNCVSGIDRQAGAFPATKK